MKIFILISFLFLNSCFIDSKIENNINQDEIINNFELISSDNYRISSKKAIIRDNNYNLFDNKIYFEDIIISSNKIEIINNTIHSKDTDINSKNFYINSKKSIYKDKILKLEKVKAKF